MAAAAYFETVQKIYIAFYQRPADPAGLKYWAEQIDLAGGNPNAVITAFGTQPESIALYGEVTAANIGTVLDKIYQAAFSRTPAEAEKAYWTEQFNAGGITASSMALAVVLGAQNADAASVANKLTVANEFTKQVDGRALTDAGFGTAPFQVTYNGDADADAARVILKPVTGDAATILTPAQITTQIKATIADPSDPINSVTQALTTGVDTLVGGVAGDVFTGLTSALSTSNTLNADDKIDGGASKDTLKVDLQASFAGFSTKGGMTNVETVELTNAGEVARTFNATGVTGVEAYNLNGVVSLAGLADTKAAVNLKGQQAATTTIDISYAAAAVAGTADSLALGLENVGKAAVPAAGTTPAVDAVRVAVKANGLEALALTTKGVNVVNVADVAGAKSITAAGAGTLDTNVAAATTSFDASANTGAVKVDLANASGATLVATGAGDDTITATTTNLLVNATINGGAGADRLVLSGAGTTQFQMSNVETIALGDLGAGLTFSAAKSTGIQALEATDKFVGNAVFAGLGATDLAFNLAAASTAIAGSITADNASASTVTVTASKATLAAATAPAAADANNTALTLNNATSLNLAVGDRASYTGTVAAAKAASVSVTGNVSGAAQIDAALATSATLNTKGASALALNAAKATDLNMNVAAGTATVPGSLTLTGAQTAVQAVNADVGANSTLTVAAGFAAANTVNLTGNGSVVLGTLGSGKEYGLTVNAGSLKDLTIKTTTVGATVGAGNAIAVNAATVLGNVDLGSLTVGTGATTGSISVNVKDVLGTVTLGALSAKDVVVNAANAIKGFTTAVDVTAGNSAEFNGSSIITNQVDIHATGASLTAKVNGGLGDDVVKIDGATTTLNYKVSGDLGLQGAGGSLEVKAGIVVATSKLTVDVSGVVAGAGALTVDATAALGATAITGSAGNDTIKLNATNGKVDTVVAGDGDDVITGASVGDILTGGAGKDTFTFTAPAAAAGKATITDFVAGTDTIAGLTTVTSTTTAANLKTALDAALGITTVLADIKGYNFDLNADGTAAAGEVVVSYAGKTYVVDASTPANGFAVELTGVTTTGLTEVTFA